LGCSSEHSAGTLDQQCEGGFGTSDCGTGLDKIVEIEPTNALIVEDSARYEAELRKELEHSYERLDIPERR